MMKRSAIAVEPNYAGARAKKDPDAAKHCTSCTIRARNRADVVEALPTSPVTFPDAERRKPTEDEA
jgi:hypothetical protein